MGGRRTADADESDRGANHSRPSTADAAATRRRFLRTAAATTLAVPTLGAGAASGAEVIDTTFTVGSVEDGAVSHEATVSYAEGTITVEGSIAVPNPCYTADLSGAELTDDDTLRVTVAAADDRDGTEPCPQVVSAVEYTATATVDEDPPAAVDDVPSTVTVVHEGAETWTAERSVFDPTPSLQPIPERPATGTDGPNTIVVGWPYREVDAPETVPLDHVNVYVDGDLDHRIEYDGQSETQTTIDGLDAATTYEVTIAGAAADGIERTLMTVEVSTPTEGYPPIMSGVGDSDEPPTDPDDDGLYEDVNGNGNQSLADAVSLFQHRESDAVQNNVGLFDFSGNDSIDLADVIQLFQENTA